MSLLVLKSVSRCSAVSTAARSSKLFIQNKNSNNSLRRRFFSNNNNNESREEYLRKANEEMQKYHQARELMKQGKLKSLRPEKNAGPGKFQIAIVGVFLVAFFGTPFVGRKIAKDKEFREKYVPSWYDFTVKKPENAWTRDELHEQMLEVQRDIRERAIAGEFTPEKLQEMRQGMMAGKAEDTLYPHRAGIDKSKIQKGWERIHPGMDDDEKLDERD